MGKGKDKIANSIFQLEPDAVIELYRIYPNTVTKPASYFNIHNGSVFGGGIIWQGELYNPVAVEAEGFSIAADGRPNRPIVRISNKDFLITSLLANNEDFRNAKIERRRTFLKFLDDENFDGGNPWGEPDPEAEITVDYYLVSQKRQENKVYVEFELTSPLDLESKDLTHRRVMGKFCYWKYRGAGCEYKGKIIEREDGKPFTRLSDNKQIIVSDENKLEAENENRSYIGMENFVYANPADIYNRDKFYRPGHIVFTINDTVRIQDEDDPTVFRPTLTYYVARNFVARGKSPKDNPDLWDKDGCGKKIHQCKKRFVTKGVQEVFLENLFYNQQMWNIIKSTGSHAGYLRPIRTSSPESSKIKTLLKNEYNRYGYNASAKLDDCNYSVVNSRDLNKDWTIAIHVGYCGADWQQYNYYQDKYRRIRQTLFRTGTDKYGNCFSIELSQRGTLLRRKVFADSNPDGRKRCATITRDINLDGKATNKGLNHVLIIRKDQVGGDARIRVYSAGAYNDFTDDFEVTKEVYIGHMHTPVSDRIFLTGGYIREEKTSDSIYLKPAKDFYSQNQIGIGTVAMWDRALTNGEINKLKSSVQTLSNTGKKLKGWVIRRYSDLILDPTAEGLFNECISFWQKPYSKNNIGYVEDHINGNDLIYKTSNYEYVGGPAGTSLKAAGYNFTDGNASMAINTEVGGKVFIDAEVGIMPFGGFPGTDGYNFNI